MSTTRHSEQAGGNSVCSLRQASPRSMTMRPPAPPSFAAIGLSTLLASSSAAFAQAPAPYVCMTRDFSKRIGYVSPVFQVAPTEAMKVNPAWNQVMTSQYGITALPYLSCQGPYPSDAVADSARTKFIENLRNTMKQQVSELSWTYDGAPAVKVGTAIVFRTAPAASHARHAYRARASGGAGRCGELEGVLHPEPEGALRL